MRFLMEDVGPGLSAVVFAYVIVVNFAVVRIIAGVFLTTTFKVASSDDDLMIAQRQRAAAVHFRKMERLFNLVDAQNKGFIDRHDFRAALQLPTLSNWLDSMEIETGDAEALFDLLDGGDGELTFEKLHRGIARLKGSARNIDLLSLQHRMYYVQRMIESFIGTG